MDRANTARGVFRWMLLRIGIPAALFLGVLCLFVVFRPGVLARRGVRLGREEVTVEVFERGGDVYGSLGKPFLLLLNDPILQVRLGPLSDLDTGSIRVESDPGGKEVVIHLGEKSFRLSLPEEN